MMLRADRGRIQKVDNLQERFKINEVRDAVQAVSKPANG
jgi:hypothetical protein